MTLVIDPEAPQTIGVCKRSKRAKLFFHQRLLQFVSCFHECHGRIVAQTSVCAFRVVRWVWIGTLAQYRGRGYTASQGTEKCPRPANGDVEQTLLVHATPARARRLPSILKSKRPIATACAASKAKSAACKKWWKTTATARTSSCKSPACRKRCAAARATLCAITCTIVLRNPCAAAGNKKARRCMTSCSN